MLSLTTPMTLSVMLVGMGKKVATAVVKRVGNLALPRPVNKHARGELKKPASSHCTRRPSSPSRKHPEDKMRTVALNLLTPGSRANQSTVSDLANLFAAVGLSPDVEMPDIDADAVMSGVDEPVPAVSGQLSSSVRKVLRLAERASAETVSLKVEAPQAPILTPVPRMQTMQCAPEPAKQAEEIAKHLSPFYVFGKLGWGAVEGFMASGWDRGLFAGFLTPPAPVWTCAAPAETSENLASSPSSMPALSVPAEATSQNLASSPSSTSALESDERPTNPAPSKRARRADYDGADTMAGRKWPTRA